MERMRKKYKDLKLVKKASSGFTIPELMLSIFPLMIVITLGTGISLMPGAYQKLINAAAGGVRPALNMYVPQAYICPTPLERETENMHPSQETLCQLVVNAAKSAVEASGLDAGAASYVFIVDGREITVESGIKLDKRPQEIGIKIDYDFKNLLGLITQRLTVKAMIPCPSEKPGKPAVNCLKAGYADPRFCRTEEEGAS